MAQVINHSEVVVLDQLAVANVIDLEEELAYQIHLVTHLIDPSKIMALGHLKVALAAHSVKITDVNDHFIYSFII